MPVLPITDGTGWASSLDQSPVVPCRYEACLYGAKSSDARSLVTLQQQVAFRSTKSTSCKVLVAVALVSQVLGSPKVRLSLTLVKRSSFFKFHMFGLSWIRFTRLNKITMSCDAVSELLSGVERLYAESGTQLVLACHVVGDGLVLSQS